MIEKVSVEQDVDGDGRPVVYLLLTGDMIEACENYLFNDSETQLRITIGRDNAQTLFEELAPLLYA